MIGTKLKDIGVTFVALYLAIIGAFFLFVAFAFYYLGIHFLPFTLTLPLVLVLAVYGLVSITAGYFLAKKAFFGWFTAVVLLSIQSLIFAFSFATIPTLLAVAMLVFLIIVKDEFNVSTAVRVETTNAPKMPEMAFVIEKEKKKFVRRKVRL